MVYDMGHILILYSGVFGAPRSAERLLGQDVRARRPDLRDLDESHAQILGMTVPQGQKEGPKNVVADNILKEVPNI